MHLCFIYEFYISTNFKISTRTPCGPRRLDLVRNLTVEQKIIPIYEYFKLQHKEYFFNMSSLGCYIDRLKNRYSFLYKKITKNVHIRSSILYKFIRFITRKLLQLGEKVHHPLLFNQCSYLN